MIKEQLNYLSSRKSPIVHTKYKDTEINHLSYEKKEKMYDYYICDYCNSEIEIKNDKKSNLLKLSPLVTKRNKTIVIVCCDKCLKNVIQEF